MTVRVVIDTRNDLVLRDLLNAGPLTRRSIRQGFFRLGFDLKRTASFEILKGQKTGRIYIIRTGRRKRRHIASAPGETHANITGKLRKSLGFKIHGSHSLDFGYGVEPESSVGRTAPIYGQFLEFGTFRMRPRPTIQNAVEGVSRNAEKHFNDEFNRLFP